MERIWTQGRRLGYEYTYKYGDWERVISRYRVSFERGTFRLERRQVLFFFIFKLRKVRNDDDYKKCVFNFLIKVNLHEA